MEFNRRQFDKTLSKEVNKEFKAKLLQEAIRRLKSEPWYSQRKKLLDEKYENDKKIAELRSYFNKKKDTEFIPRSTLNEIDRLSRISRSKMFDVHSYEKDHHYLKSLEVLLRGLTEDTRLNAFVEAARSTLDKNTYKGIWSKANVIYEERISEAAEMSSGELLKQ